MTATTPAAPVGSRLGIRVQWLGRMDYLEALRRQEHLAAMRAEGRIPDTLLLMEHPPAITLGPAALPEHLRVPEPALRQRGIAVHGVRRGGGITLHAPGQLVGYPIMHLAPLGGDLHAYVRMLERTLVQAVAEFGVRAEAIPGLTGVWVGDQKLAAIGIQVRRGVAFHGFTLNVDLDLSLFDLIVPCGLATRGVTSLARLCPRPPSLERAGEVLASAFCAEFGRARVKA